MSLLFHSRWQHLLSPLRGFAAAALGKRIGSSVRPPKNEQLNLARDLLFRYDSKDPEVWKDDFEIAILRALCGIGEILEELRAPVSLEVIR